MNDENNIYQNHALINNPLDNENNNNENNYNYDIVIDNINQPENDLVDDNLENQLMNNNSFFDKFSSQEIFEIINNFIPPLFYTLLIYYSFNPNGTYCDMNVYHILKTFICIYISYIAYSIYLAFLIYNNKTEQKALKVSLHLINAIITTFYFFSVFLSYLIYTKNDSKCFIQDNFITIVFYAILFIGLVNAMQKALTLSLVVTFFSFLVNQFFESPSHFYSQYGIDPEIIRNLPTVSADEKHIGCCAICTDNIKKGDEIMILNCPGNHFFHSNCIKSWLIVKTTCPMCRSENVF